MMKNLNDGIVMYNKSILYVFVLVFVLGGCATMSESQQSTAKGTAMGTGAGAAVGAIMGAIAGDPALGAGIGAGVGAVGGYIWSNRMEEQKRKMEAATEGTQVSVTQTADNQLKVNVPSDISFDTGQSTIKPEMHPVLNSCLLYTSSCYPVVPPHHTAILWQLTMKPTTKASPMM